MKCITRDISLGGVGLYANEPLEIGDSFCLTLPINKGLDGIMMNVEVLRCEKNPDEKYKEFEYLIACKFNKDLSQEDLKNILKDYHYKV
jgi:hypothetical protein